MGSTRNISIKTGISLLLIAIAAISALAADNISSLTNANFNSNWATVYSTATAKAGPPTGWTTLDCPMINSGAGFIAYTGAELATGAPDGQRCKWEFQNTGSGQNHVIAKEVNWGSASSITVSVWCSCRNWGTVNPKTGTMSLGIDADGSGASWSNCPSGNIASVSGGNITWQQLSKIITKPTGASTFTVMLNAKPDQNGSWNCQFDLLQITVNCSLPKADLSVGASANPIVSGQSINITVASSEIGVLYQLRKNSDNTNVGSPVSGNGSTINLSTGVLTATTTFNVLAYQSGNSSCSQQLNTTKTITIATPVTSIQAAKAYPDGTVIKLTDKPVSISTASAYWIQETNRSCGIKIVSNSMPSAGTKMTVYGTLATTTGERRIDSLSETPGSSGNVPKPVYMRATALGGKAFNSNSPGVVNATGPNNIGLFVKTSGRVTVVGSSFFYIDDGSNINDGTTTGDKPNLGIRVVGLPGSLKVNEYTTVTGASSSFLNPSSQLQRAIVQISADCIPPNANLTVGANSNNACYNMSVNITVASSEVGVNYQLRKSAGNVDVGTAVPGNGGIINLPTGALTSNTTFNILATNATTGCAVQLASSKTISVTQPPDANLSVGASPSTIDYNMSTNVNVMSSQVGVNYQLRINGSNVNVGTPVAGNAGAINLPTGSLNGTTTFNILATNATTGCSIQLIATVTINVNPQSTTSKFGVHVVIGSRNGFGPFLQECAAANHPVAVVKCVDDFGAATEAKGYSRRTVTVGRLNDIDGIDLQGFDGYTGMNPADAAALIYSHVKPKWLLNPQIDIWEVCNEWSWWWGWQADFYIAFMDLAERDGFRLALYGCSGGNPPEAFWPDIARACARAKAHGNHILTLHEYAWDGLLQDYYAETGDDIVLRYRRFYTYLKTQNADCPLVLSEVGENGGGGFVGTAAFVNDFAWYDSELKKDSYVIGCAAWTLGNWSGANFQDALPALADYVSTH